MNGRPWNERDLEVRIHGTLELMARRGYNPTTEHLATKLLGGREEVGLVEEAIEDAESLDTREGLAFIEGKSYIEMCKARLAVNGEHQPVYRAIAEEYTRDLVTACPWVKCVMLVGSVATGGLCLGDDLDLNVVVEDGRKYSTNVIGSLINRKYSYRHGKALEMEKEGHYLVPMVVCLNIIWEESQVMPLARQDEQVAYEIYSADVLYGQDYYDRMLTSNEWLRDHFPQMYDAKGGYAEAIEPTGNGRAKLLEVVSRRGLFAFERMVRMYLSKRPGVVERMDHYDRLKHPYGLYHVPGREETEYRE
ncbi:MAG: hypothetical protein JSW25_08805 [Thermoplasmata archaeon]|nr:MAG: hypothetical protein JSW25_08805 [Thermoplasmata archaeon]